ncbi:MAG: tRNA pseudouridine(13) synthase TruD [Hydrogenovibrio sp.]|nr:tRNA pseudouridine(13) synthase TruD [Hydrogenovibrio sp.]
MTPQFDFAHAYGKPVSQAKLKARPEDFIVEERIAYDLSGEGEHLWIWVEKCEQNTDWVAKQIAGFIGIAPREMGVAGKKDRHAVTRQWMSCHLPGKADPDFSALDIPGVKVLKKVRHSRKLQTGGLAGNHFQIRLTGFDGEVSDVESRLQVIREQGVPNYFGEQRFGNDFQNLANASRMFRGDSRPKRHQKTMYLSAVRSWIFNEVLSLRIEQKNWNQYVGGDVFQLEGSQKWFADDGSDDLPQRLTALDIHPTGPLIGRGELPSQQSILALEQSVVDHHPLWRKGLENAGMKQERRALRVLPKQLDWQWEKGVDNEQNLLVHFDLPAGAFATMVIRELVND